MAIWMHRGVVYAVPEAEQLGYLERNTRYRHIRDGALDGLKMCPRGNMALEAALQSVWRVASREILLREEGPWLPGIV